jgi:pimeloyl-ACP methyl ester carboxylesterase
LECDILSLIDLIKRGTVMKLHDFKWILVSILLSSSIWSGELPVIDGNLSYSQKSLSLYREDTLSLTRNRPFLRHMCGESDGKPLIFIHGFGTDASRWDYMYGHLANRGICGDYAVYYFQYDWRRRISFSARRLLAYMRREKFVRSPVIVAHSMGGLVAREALRLLAMRNPQLPPDAIIGRLVTLGTPHLGSKLASLSYLPVCASARDLRKSSRFIRRLNDSADEKRLRSRYYLAAGTMGYYYKCVVWDGEECSVEVPVWRDSYSDAIKATYMVLRKPNDGIVERRSALFIGDASVHRVGWKRLAWYSHAKLLTGVKAHRLVYAKLMEALAEE